MTAIQGILITLVLGFSTFSFADMDVTCAEGGCLENGWTIRTGAIKSEIYCEDDNCAKFGWTEYRHRRMVGSVECIFESCFGEGWDLYDARRFRVAETRCRSGEGGHHHRHSSCMKYGWETRDFRGARTRYECIAGSCAKHGWDVYLPTGRIQTVRCKKKGCFVDGWRLRD